MTRSVNKEHLYNFWHKLNVSLNIATNTTSVVPIYIFTNGTYSFPFIPTGLTGLTGLTSLSLGFGSLFNFFPGFGIFGRRSFSNSLMDINWFDLFGLYGALGQTLTILNEKRRLSCFDYILCSQYKMDDPLNWLFRYT